MPFLHELRLVPGAEALRDVLVELRADPPFFAPVTWRCERIEAREDRRVDLPAPALSPSFLAAQTERSDGHVQVVVSSEGREIAQARRPVEVLAPTHWPGVQVLPELLAAFVRPNARVLAPVLQAAAVHLERLGAGSALCGYQRRDPQHAARMVQAVWEATRAVGLTYLQAPASFESTGQKVRTHEMVLADRLGNCLDLTVLLAALLEQVGLNALLVLVEGHAFVGAWLTPFELPEPVLDDPAPLRKRVEIGEALVVDSSPLTEGASFEDGVASAERWLADKDRFLLAVDLAAARHGARPVRPLPLGEDRAPAEVKAPELDGQARPWRSDRFRPAAEGAPSQEPLASRLDRWQRRLLDLSLRNRLLNHKEGARSLPLPRVPLSDLEDGLARGQSFQLLPRAEGRQGSAAAPLAEPDAARLAAEALALGRLLVDAAPAALDKVALELDRLARSAVEETGSTALYLGLGMLRWFESAAAEEPRYAPLILVPVRLVRPPLGGRWQVVSAEEEPRVNVTLVQKLKADFGIDLGALDQPPTDEFGLDVLAILQGFRRAIVELPRWEVLEQATLTTFSFAKFLLWLDLVAKREQLLANPIVRQIVEGTPAPSPSGRPLLAEDEVPSARTPAEVLTVVDADPTQLRAILAAEDGHSFVLQGPPGTGKSQTITNLVAQLVAGGKSVLFVSEKLAALEVVHRRLQKVGLGPFCLELHSDKATRVGVVQQLKAPFELKALGDGRGWLTQAEALAAAQAPLDAHAARLRQPTPFGVPLREVVTTLVGLAEAPRLTLEVSVQAPGDLRRLESALERWLSAAGEVGEVKQHPWRDVGLDAWSPRREDAVLSGIQQLTEALLGWERALPAALAAFRLERPAGGWAAEAALADLAQAVLSAPSGLPRLMVEGAGLATLGTWTAQARERQRARRRLMEVWQPGLWTLDLAGLADRYQRWAGAFFLFAFFALWSARRALGAVRLGPLPPAPSLRDELAEARELQAALPVLAEADPELRAALGGAWRGVDSDLDVIEGWAAAAARLRAARSTVAAHLGSWTATERAVALATEEQPLLALEGPLRTSLTALITARAEVERAHGDLVQQLKMPAAGLFGEGLEAVRRRLAAMRQDRAGLRIWTAQVEAAREAEQAGLGPIVLAFLSGALRLDQARPALLRSVLEPWWWSRLEADPDLAKFRGAQHAEVLRKFQQLDQASLERARAEVVRRAALAVPDLHAPGEEMALLRRQLQLQRRHLPPRKLFAQLPQVLRRIKPVLLMSPASVARFLDPALPAYDVVVFDEASQIPPWEAIGALARGRQAVIVGDSKQLPPTSFFDRAEGEDGELLDDEALEEVDSILEEAAASSLPQLPLRWHYRSRHESLIAFSNRYYYENRLHTFPSAEAHLPGVGLELRALPPGSYDRGGSRTNRPEAEALVAELEQLLSLPEDQRPSLGVVTFSMAQQRLVQDLTDALRQRRPELDRAFLEGLAEPVFIKNLENVQGDERDVMLFSVGYGADPTGKVVMSFGPLNRSGGERRLNVAITRARSRLIVFSTLDPDQIDLNRTSALGARHLRAFLRYAREGQRALDAETLAAGVARFESPFEQQVHDALVEAGHLVHSQVGCSGYRIDLAVVDPKRPGRYLLGVECDGAAYHSSRSARERDRLRQAVLENLGWRMIRVWSTDWWHDPKAQVERLLTAIEEARRAAPVAPPPTAAAAPPAAALPAPSVAAQLAAPAPVPLPAEASPWEGLVAVVGGAPESFHEPETRSILGDQLVSVVIGGPVARESAFRHLASAWGFSRLGAKIQATLEAAWRQLPAPRRPVQQGDFLWPASVDPSAWAGFRPDPYGRRGPSEVAPEELRNAAAWVRRRGVGLREEEVVHEVVRLFGWTRSRSAPGVVLQALSDR